MKPQQKKEILRILQVARTPKGWPCKFKIRHSDFPPDKVKLHDQLAQVKKTINGLYAYYYKNQCLYIGKGKPVWSRLKTHWIETTRNLKSDRKGYWKYDVFFGHFADYELEVRYIEFGENDTDRLIAEKVYQELENPLYDQFANETPRVVPNAKVLKNVLKRLVKENSIPPA